MTTVTISLPSSFFDEVDQTARSEQRNHSELLREAFALYLKVRAERQPNSNSSVQRAVAVQDALAKVASGSDEDSTTDIQEWRARRK